MQKVRKNLVNDIILQKYLLLEENECILDVKIVILKTPYRNKLNIMWG